MKKIFKNETLQLYKSILEKKNMFFKNVINLYNKYYFLFNESKIKSINQFAYSIDSFKSKILLKCIDRYCNLNSQQEDIRYLNNYFFVGKTIDNTIYRNTQTIHYRNMGVFNRMYFRFLELASICRNNGTIQKIKDSTIHMLLNDCYHYCIYEISLIIRQITTVNCRNTNDVSIYKLSIPKSTIVKTVNGKKQLKKIKNPKNVIERYINILNDFIESNFLSDIRSSVNHSVSHILTKQVDKYFNLVPNKLFNAFECLYVLLTIYYYYVSTND